MNLKSLTSNKQLIFIAYNGISTPFRIINFCQFLSSSWFSLIFWDLLSLSFLCTLTVSSKRDSHILQLAHQALLLPFLLFLLLLMKIFKPLQLLNHKDLLQIILSSSFHLNESYLIFLKEVLIQLQDLHFSSLPLQLLFLLNLHSFRQELECIILVLLNCAKCYIYSHNSILCPLLYVQNNWLQIQQYHQVKLWEFLE